MKWAAFMLALAMTASLAVSAQQRPSRKPIPPTMTQLQPPSPSAAEGQKPPQDERSTPQQPTNSQQRGTEDRPVIVKILPAEKTAEERAQEAADRSDKSSADWWLVRLTGALAGVGILQFLALIGQAVVFRVQANALRESVDLTRQIADRQERDMRDSITEAARAATAMRDSADAAIESAGLTRILVIASQRAWLAAEISLVKDQEEIVFNQNGGVLPIRIAIKNVGNAPAIKVSWHAWLIFGGSNALQEQSLRCSKIRQERFGIGPTIFPQQQYPDPDSDWSFGAGVSWEEIGRVLIGVGNRRIVGASVVGCVDYAFPTDPDVHHQTGFVYHVSMPDSEIPEIAAQSGNIPVVIRGLVKADLTLDPGAV